MRRRAVYPGTFDPVTNGHLDVIKRAATIFDEVIVACAANPSKEPLFSIAERLAMLRQATRGMRHVRVDQLKGLVVQYAQRAGASVVVRGLRMLSDFEYEFQMALTNRRLNHRVETVFMMPSEECAYLSSKLIKEAAMLDGDVSHFVPPFVAKALRVALGRR